MSPAPARTQASQATSYDWRGLEALVAPLQRYLTARCSCASDVQDVLQETLMRAARYRHNGVEAGRLRSWTMSIAANVLRDQGRRRTRGPSVGHEDLLFQQVPGRELEPGWSEYQPPLQVEERMVEMDQMLAHLQAAMTHLSKPDRMVLARYYAPGGTTRSAAHAMSLKPNVIKVRLFRARQRLRRHIEEKVAERAKQSELSDENRMQTCA